MTSASDLIEQADAILLDFDGPMATLMPPPLNAEAAERVRDAAGVGFPPELLRTTDHLAVLRYCADQPDARSQAEAAATRFEVECAARCTPAQWLIPLLSQLAQAGTPWGVVTNNSPESVERFLQRLDVSPPLVIAGRLKDKIELMKPNPFLVGAAASQLQLDPARILFIGDSVSDVEAGAAAGVAVLGYAKHESRLRELMRAGAIAVYPAYASGGPA